jgi:integrase
MADRRSADRSIFDPNNYRQRLQNQLELVQTDLDHQADADAIMRWANQQRDLAATTVTGRLNCIRKLAERSATPLTEIESADVVYELLGALGDGTHPDVKDDGLSDGTLRQYRQAARLFFRDELGREWGEDIEIGQPDASPVSPEQILTSDEIDALLEACTTPRDSAVIAFLTVTGQRITATLSIRVGDVEFGDRTATVHLNDDAVGLKGASGPRPLLWSRSYIANWLENHPRRGDPEAPLFCTTQGGQRPTESGEIIEWEAGDPLSRHQIQTRIRKVADRAGIDRSKVKMHNFRHTAITRMRNQGTPDDRIRFMVGVAAESDILERYDHADNQQMMARIREAHGIASEDDLDVGQPSTRPCGSCGTQLRGTARFCPKCGAPQDVSAADSIDDQKQAILDDLDSSDPQDRRLARETMEDLFEDPEFQELVVEQMLDSHGSSP